MQIYIHREDQDYGPYSLETAREYIEQGVFHAADYGWHEGLPEWKPVGELVGLGANGEPAHLEPAPVAPVEPAPVPAAFASPARVVPPEVAPPRMPASAFVQYRPRRFATDKPKRSGAMIALNIVLVVIAACAADVRYGNGGPIARRYFAMISTAIHGTPQEAAPQESNAQPAPVPAATPTLVEATPAPAPAAEPVAAPAPPKAFDIADVAGNPAAWPKSVMLKQASAFPAVYNAQVVGKITVPAGTLVHLVGIKGTEVELEYNGGGERLAWQLTDLEQRVTKP